MIRSLFHVSVPDHAAFHHARTVVACEGVLQIARRMRDASGARELVLVATCQRVEAFALCGESARHTLVHAVADAFRVSPDLLRVLRGPAVAHHAMRLSAGLESRLVGECEVLGQLRTALAEARLAGTLGPALERLLGIALKAGKEVRSTTRLGRPDATWGTLVARWLSERVPGSLPHIVLIGSGQVARACADQFASTSRVTILARHPALARERIPDARVAVRDLRDIEQLLDDRTSLMRADALVAATASCEIIVSPRTLVQRTLPLLLVDVAMPPNIDPACAGLPGVTLATLHDLLPGERLHTEAVRGAEHIAARHADAFLRWFGARSLSHHHARVPA
jgi:glutamyl-tRNA reductase